MLVPGVLLVLAPYQSAHSQGAVLEADARYSMLFAHAE